MYILQLYMITWFDQSFAHVIFQSPPSRECRQLIQTQANSSKSQRLICTTGMSYCHCIFEQNILHF